ncbi:hypothetical protein FQA39_LY06655 [Lamprigera yunnana]|nr:hypothetical protein FQA39_LY06655 [Lamprigera yunnana]
MVTYVGLHQKRFPQPVNFKINSKEFLLACRNFVEMLELFGTSLSPATYDLNGNILKLTKTYEKDCDKHMYLEDMILMEKQEGDMIATDALMWLRRSLSFLLEFFDGFCNETEKETSAIIKRAYTNTLKSTMVGLQLVACRIPQRSVLLKTLAMGKEDYEDIVINDVKEFINNLRLCVEHLGKFYQDNGLEVEQKV